MNRRRFFSILLLALIFAATAPFSRAADPATFVVGPFTFKRPANFSWVPVNPAGMRKAQLKFIDPANPSGPGAEIVFFHFGAGQGGGVDANISRWLGQFSETGDKLNPVVEAATVGGTKVTRVRVEHGTFSSGMPGGPTTPMTDYGLQGAILESPQGDVFIKMTGPAAAVKAAAADFEALVTSPLQGAPKGA